MTNRFLVLAFVLCGGCATGPEAPVEAFSSSAEDERRCAPPGRSPRGLAPNLPLQSSTSGAQAEGGNPAPTGFSPHAWKIAEITQTGNLITRLLPLEIERAQHPDSPSISLVEARQELSDHLLLTTIDIASVSAELNCEKERTDQLAQQLGEKRNTRVTHMTIFAIVGGALVGILSGGLNLAGEATAAAAGAVSGGALEAAFGTAALVYEPQHEFRHSRNHLREFWEAPSQPLLFPPSVWRYLNQQSSDSQGGRSERETILSQWRQTGLLDDLTFEPDGRQIPLVFTDGGSYTIEELRGRAAMLTVIRTHVDLMSEDLNLLIREIFAHRAVGSSPISP